MIQLKNYQKEVLDGSTDDGQAGILEISTRLLKAKKSLNEVLIKAITGAGKTVILGEYINSMYKIISQDSSLQSKPLVFVWFSVGTGGLHIQSSNKIKAMLQDTDIKIICPKDEEDFNEQKFIDKTLLILNWEKINNTDNGELISNLLIGEKHNLKACIEKSDVNFIAIVDEFHRNYETEAYNKLMELFDPKIVLGVTATPSKKQAKIKHGYQVPTSKVKEEGMIKIGTIFNEGLDGVQINDNKDMMEVILDLAIQKRHELEMLYREEGSDVIPLCLIQLPNKTVDPNMKDNVVQYLSNYNDNGSILKENEDFTVWISNEKEDSIIDNLNTNGIKFLIFKQAVAVGWDCPRSHILVKFRPFKKELEAFDLQTIGRVLRTPEHKHYQNQALNYAYIYAEDKKIEFDNEVKEAFDGSSPSYENQKIKEDFLGIVQSAEKVLLTQKYKENEPDNKIIRAKLEENLVTLCEHKDKNDNYKKIIIDTFNLDTDKLDEFDSLDNKPHERKEIDASKKIIRNQYEKFIYELSKKGLASERDLKIILKNHFTKNLGESISGATQEEIEMSFIELVLSYKNGIEKAINETSKDKNLAIVRVPNGYELFKFDKSPKYQCPPINFGNKNIYRPGVDTGFSEPEKTFINILDKNDNVVAWFKNKDKGSHALCVIYETAIQIKGKTVIHYSPTYPDFIVFFKNGEIGIYEIKDFDKHEDVNKDKSLAINNHINKLNHENPKSKFYGGLVFINQTTNTIENKNNFPELR